MKEFIKRIQTDMVLSMRLKEKFKTKVLKSLISDLNYSLKSEAPAAPMEILIKSIKKRSDALEQYKNADRSDLVQAEQEEISILEKYLDRKKTNEELVAIIQRVIKNNATDSKVDFGKVMKVLTLELNAAEAPRAVLSKLVKNELKMTMGK